MSFLKKLFKVKENKIHEVTGTECIRFNDLAGLNVVIEKKVDAHDTILLIHDAESKFNVVLSQEQALLLSSIFNEYATKQSLKESIKLIKE